MRNIIEPSGKIKRTLMLGAVFIGIYILTSLLMRLVILPIIIPKPTFDSTLVNTASELNKNLPMVIDSETSLDSITALPNRTMRYNLTLINMASEDYNVEEVIALINEPLRNRIKTIPEAEFFRKNGVSLSYYYFDMNNKYFFEIKIPAGEY